MRVVRIFREKTKEVISVKALKILGRVLLILLALTVLLLLSASGIYHLKLRHVLSQMKDEGYFHPVSVGDHSLNVYCCGNENGQHTVVALAGLLDGEFCIGWRQMTAEIEPENRLVFIDRAGYGLSDDSAQDMTAEQITEDYRAALRGAGIAAP